MADSPGLQVGAGGNHAAVHGDQLCLSPVHVGFLALAVHELEVGLLLHELSDDAQLERTVLSLCEVIAVELDDVGVVLHLHELYCFLLVLVELVQIFGLNLFQGVVLASVQMDCFVDLRVLLARPQHLQFLEICFLEHSIIYL